MIYVSWNVRPPGHKTYPRSLWHAVKDDAGAVTVCGLSVDSHKPGFGVSIGRQRTVRDRICRECQPPVHLR